MPFFQKPRMLYTFDKSIIKRNWSKINESPIKRAGLLARTIERGLIRKDTSRSQRPSKPGRPPKSRATGHPFRKIYSVPNYLETSAVVGHVGWKPGLTAMEIQEFGKTVRIRRPQFPSRQRITDPVRRAKIRQLFLSGKIKSKPTQIVTEMVKMPERPFALPTTQRVAKRMPALWKNSVNASVVN